MDRYELRRLDYSLTEDHKDLQAAYRQLFDTHCSIETVWAAEESGYDKSLWERLCAMGASSMAISEDAGGDGATGGGQGHDRPEDGTRTDCAPHRHAHDCKLADPQPTLDVAVERRPARRTGGRHAVALHQNSRAAELCGAARHPASRTGSEGSRPQPRHSGQWLDHDARRLAVEQHRVVDDGLSGDGVGARRQPARGPDDHRPGLVADQWNTLSHTASGASCRAESATREGRDEADLNVEPVVA